MNKCIPPVPRSKLSNILDTHGMDDENVLNEVQYSFAYHNVFAHVTRSWDIEYICDGVTAHVDSQGLRELYKGKGMVSPYMKKEGGKMATPLITLKEGCKS